MLTRLATPSIFQDNVYTCLCNDAADSAGWPSVALPPRVLPSHPVELGVAALVGTTVVLFPIISWGLTYGQCGESAVGEGVVAAAGMLLAAAIVSLSCTVAVWKRTWLQTTTDEGINGVRCVCMLSLRCLLN